MRISDWSSDVCSSDLKAPLFRGRNMLSFRGRNMRRAHSLINPRRKTMASSPDPLPKPKPDTIEPQSPPERPVQPTPLDDPAGQPAEIQIGRQTSRERACQYV